MHTFGVQNYGGATTQACRALRPPLILVALKEYWDYIGKVKYVGIMIKTELS